MLKLGTRGLVLLACASFEAAAQFCPGLSPWVFTDVPSNHPFCTDITWMAQRGVTLGCASINPTQRLYCPDQGVRRDQMAAFMHRLGNAILPLSCSTGQVMRWNGTSWACASVGGVGSLAQGAGIVLTPNPITTTGTIAADIGYLQRRVTGSCSAGSSIRMINADGSVACETDDSGLMNAFVQGGNAVNTTAVLGTTSNQPLNLIVNGTPAMRYEPAAISANVIGGNPDNFVSAGTRGATIGGGGGFNGVTDPDTSVAGDPNAVTDAYGTVGGGNNNRAGNSAGSAFDSAYATVGGGTHNRAAASFSTVGGGVSNSASGASSSVGGGAGNSAMGQYSTVAGGNLNSGTAPSSAVGGGYINTASGSSSFVGGGSNNRATGRVSSIGGGEFNIAVGNASTVPGGMSNYAGGDYSVAMGRRAVAIDSAHGSFVFADSTDANFSSFAPNEFVVRASGGIGFYSSANASTYCALFTGSGSWSCVSSRDVKDDFAAVDSGAMLDKVVALPISSWRFKAEPAEVRHIGPFAQDFRAAFGLGADDRTISTIDIQGVALAAIQGLHAKLEAHLRERDAEIQALRRTIDWLVSRSASTPGSR